MNKKCYILLLLYLLILYYINNKIDNITSSSIKYKPPSSFSLISSKSDITSTIIDKDLHYFLTKEEVSRTKVGTIDVKSEVRQRKYFHPKEEILLTANVTIDAKPCNSGQSLAVFIHSSAQSSGEFFEKRQILRNAWIRQLMDRNVSVYFLIGLNSDPIVNQKLRLEADKYEDLIQFGFIDHYYNLTLKSISMLRWIQSKCQTIAYTLKTDDDVMINVENLMNRLNEFKSGITGFFQPRISLLPVRSPNSEFNN